MGDDATTSRTTMGDCVAGSYLNRCYWQTWSVDVDVINGKDRLVFAW